MLAMADEMLSAGASAGLKVHYLQCSVHIEIILIFTLKCTIKNKNKMGNLILLLNTVEALLTDSLKQKAVLVATFTKHRFSQLPNKIVFLHSCKRPAPVMGTFFVSRWSPLTRASTVLHTIKT